MNPIKNSLLDSLQSPLVKRNSLYSAKRQKGPPCPSVPGPGGQAGSHCAKGPGGLLRGVPQPPHGLAPRARGLALLQPPSRPSRPWPQTPGFTLLTRGHRDAHTPPPPSCSLQGFMDPAFWSFLKTVDAFPVEIMTFSVSHYVLHNASGKERERGKANKAWEPAPSL